MAGTTTLHLNNLLDEFIRKNDAIPACLGYKGYPREVCISVNEVICHGIPNENQILVDGDILNIDVTTILDGYYGDTSRMYTVGTINPEVQRLLDVTKNALNVGIAQVWPGNYFNRIGYEINRYAFEGMYCGVVNVFCGHGTGVEFHEGPQISHACTYNKADRGDVMQPGMTFTIEPMINEASNQVIIEDDQWTAKTADGKLSAQYEHTLLVTETGVEILTEI